MWYFQNKHLTNIGNIHYNFLKYLVIVINPCKSLLVFIKVRLNTEDFMKSLGKS